MRRFFTVLAICALVFVIQFMLYWAFCAYCLPGQLEKYYGPDTRTQIEQSFNQAGSQDYDILIVGNSRIYRGINPDRFSRSAYNFAHDNDNYNQIFWKLKWLEDKGKSFDTLIMGVDCFAFSFLSGTRNYVYSDYLGSGYNADYSPFKESVNHFFSIANPDVVTAWCKKAISKERPQELPYLKTNGQYYYPGQASAGDTINDRDCTRQDIQVEYFQKIIDYCADKGIDLILVTPPTRNEELSCYTEAQLQDFSDFVLSYNLPWWDYSTDSRFTLDNFADITHLNPQGADFFSDLINGRLEAHK